jgi:hypothetical protein
MALKNCHSVARAANPQQLIANGFGEIAQSPKRATRSDPSHEHAWAAFRGRNPQFDTSTSTSQGRLLVTMLAAVAEFERELIRERTGEGRKRAMQNGVRFGRKPKLSDFQRKEALARRGAGETLAQIARSYAVSVSMISRL